MIVVEGPDGSGKTTLFKRLSEDLDLGVINRACTSDNGPVENLARWVENNLPEYAARHNRHKRIIDRHPLISDPIYGSVIRGGFVDERFNDTEWFTTVTRRLYQRSIIIYCLPPLPIVLNNVEGSHEGTTDHLKGVLKSSRAIWSLYLTRMAADLADSNRLAFHWDYTKRGTYAPLLVNLSNMIEEQDAF